MQRVTAGCGDVGFAGWRSTPKPVPAAGGEAMVKVCGVAVAMLPGQ